jgi:hypothetical protein
MHVFARAKNGHWVSISEEQVKIFFPNGALHPGRNSQETVHLLQIFGLDFAVPGLLDTALLATVRKGTLSPIDHIHLSFNHLAHEKLGHLFGIPWKTHRECETCAQTKLTRPAKPAPSLSSNITYAGQRIDRDTKPLPRRSRDGHLYYEFLIDFFSRFSWVIGIAEQKEANETFARLRLAIEAQTGKKVAYLQNDSHPHYTKRSFVQYAERTGLTLRQSIPNEQWQNGFCERHIRMLEEGARSSVVHGGAPDDLYFHAVCYANRVQNAVPNKPDARHPRGGAPIEIWHDRKFPDLFKRFQPLFCLAYAKKTTTTGDPHTVSQKGVFVGLSKMKNGWDILIPSSNRIISAHAVQFFSSRFPFREAMQLNAPNPSVSSIRNRATYEPLTDAPKPASLTDPLVWPDTSVEAPDSSFDPAAFLQPLPTSSSTTHQAGIDTELENVIGDGFGELETHSQPAAPHKLVAGERVSRKSNNRSCPERVSGPTLRSFSPGRRVSFAPNTKSGKSAERYAEYSTAKTIGEARSKGMTTQDFRWDSDRGLVTVHTLIDTAFRVDELRAATPTPGAGHVLQSEIRIPKSPQQAFKCEEPQATFWKQAMLAECDALLKLGAMEPVTGVEEDPGTYEYIPLTWAFKVQLATDRRTVQRFKARLCAQGCRRKLFKHFDLHEVFAQCLRIEIMRTVFSLAIQDPRCRITHLDIKNAFVAALLHKAIYVKSIPGMPFPVGTLLKLKRALYGLQESMRLFEDHLSALLVGFGFKRLETCRNVYIFSRGAEYAIMPVQVDDMFLCCNSAALKELVLAYLRKHLELKDLGDIANSMGMEFRIDYDSGVLEMSMESQIRGLLEGAGMLNCNPKSMPLPFGARPSPKDAAFSAEDAQALQDLQGEYRTHLGKLIYISRCLLYSLCFPVSILGKRQNSPRRQDVNNMKNVLRFCRGNITTKLIYTRRSSPEAYHVVYADADLDAGTCQVSHIEYVAGNAVGHGSGGSAHSATSSMHAEMMAGHRGCRQAMGTRHLLQEMHELLQPNPFFKIHVPIVVTDNRAFYLRVTGQTAHHEQVKHIRRRYMYSCQLFRFGDIKYASVPGADMLANQGTKADTLALFKKHNPVCLGHIFDEATCGVFSELSASRAADAHFEVDLPPEEVWIVRGKFHHIDCPIKPDHDRDLLIPLHHALAMRYENTCSCSAFFGNPRKG